MVKPIRAVTEDPIKVRRLEAAAKRIGMKDRAARATIELALQRAKQLEDFGDVPMLPARGLTESSSPNP